MAKRKPRRKPTALAVLAAQQLEAAGPGGVLGVFERLARDKRLTVEKLGELIALQERILDRDAKSAFTAAYERMQPALPRIAKRGKILNKQGSIQSRYSKYEDIRGTVDPLLRLHGFTFHTRTEWPETGVLEVVGVLTHAAGHSRESRFRSKADGSGGKNEIQGLGSGVSYGKRYTLKDLLAIVEEGEDDDGQRFAKAQKAAAKAPVVEAHYQGSGEPITQTQRQRWATILRHSGRNTEDVRVWLRQRYGVGSSQEITRDAYDEICRAIEAPGPLPVRSPGEDG